MTTREIKFRAWDRGRMFNDLAFISMGGGGMSKNPDTPLIDPILMQYTGLHDKNGVEIYEGDILKKLYGSSDPHFVVRWHQERLMFIQQDRGLYNEPLYQAPMNYCEVIGNIYEHAHLLNPKES